jgi:hypothetical protein
MPSVALLTCAQLPEPDPDQELLLSALTAAGLDARMLAWDDPAGDPAAFDLVVLRSCWNYYEHAQAFAAWIDAAAPVTELSNPASVVRWNLHKAYLRELEHAGLPMIPTEWCTHGQSVQLATVMDAQGWDDVVVKPSISASSYRTRRFGREQLAAGQVFLDGLLADRDAMIQRTIVPPNGHGERALVWIDGELTHAISKSPRFAGGVETVSHALPVSDGDRRLAERALACVDAELLYARIDVMTDSDGNPLVSELELMEPSLYLVQSSAALDRFVVAMARRTSRAS